MDLDYGKNGSGRQKGGPKDGTNGTNRMTGGGGSGNAHSYAYSTAEAYAGAGSAGTSYSGGTGGGGASVSWDVYFNSGTAQAGLSNAGKGGYAVGGSYTAGRRCWKSRRKRLYRRSIKW